MGEGAVTVFAIACNYAVSVSESARGSRAYVLNVNYGGGSERVRILARSRSGRWIDRWESIKRLDRFRAVKPCSARPIFRRVAELDGCGFEISDLVYLTHNKAHYGAALE